MEDDTFPIDFAAKIQPSHSTDQKIYGHNPEDAEYTICKFHRSTWFVDHPRWVFLHPHQKLLISTYEQDKYIIGREPEDEVERYAELESIADGAFPGDRFTYDYNTMSRREVTREIEECVHRQLAIKQMMNDRNIDLPLFPVIPGWEDWHFEHCHPLIEEIGASVGFDTTQVNSKYDKQEHLETLEEVLDVDRVFVNGTVARSHLRLMPESVVAFSGKASILEEIRDENGVHHRDQLSESIEKRVPEIYNWQTELNEF
jgi:hypothetical protein